jgi:hypothetical protein
MYFFSPHKQNSNNKNYPPPQAPIQEETSLQVQQQPRSL